MEVRALALDGQLILLAENPDGVDPVLLVKPGGRLEVTGPAGPSGLVVAHLDDGAGLFAQGFGGVVAEPP